MSSRRPLKKIRLELARSKEHPDGSPDCGYEFVAPLAPNNQIDVDAWKTMRAHCTARRFWHGEEDQTGLLVHKAGGSDGATWIFDYNDERDDDDEAGYRFGIHTFLPGEYVTIQSHDKAHTFRVAHVDNEPD